MELAVVVGDITTFEVDAIVNAANKWMLGGGGADGAIHRAAGPDLDEGCKALGICPEGEVRVTGGHRLPARWIIHTVGPVWDGGDFGEADVLARCYQGCIGAADALHARTVACTAISTGHYGFPPELAAEIAARTLRATPTKVETITLVAFTEADEVVLRAALAAA